MRQNTFKNNLHHTRLSRRSTLKGGTTVLSLPLLESMLPAKESNNGNDQQTKRFVGINIPMGFHSPNFFPEDTGFNYKLSSYLKPAEKLKKNFTVISGTSLPLVNGGHSAEKCFLTGAPHPDSRSFKNSISLDQLMAKKIGKQTRYASLSLGHQSLSWSSNGVSIPAESRPDKLFLKLFSKSNSKSLEEAIHKFEDGLSVMDYVYKEAKSINKVISKADQHKLEQYFTAVRESELRLQKAKEWENKPKPNISDKNPGYSSGNDIIGNFKRFLEVMRLALVTDQTRIITLGGQGGNQVPPLKGVSTGYHALTHHGQNPQMIKQLEIIDRETLKAWAEWIQDLKDTEENGESLLSSTHVLLGSNLGSASGHITTNLPILLAGGSFKHGQHIAFNKKKNEPLTNTYLSILHAMNIKEKSFSSSNRKLPGLELI